MASDERDGRQTDPSLPALACSTTPSRQPPDFVPATVPRGEVKIIVDRCKGCGFCVEYCPKDVLVLSTGFNRKGYHPPEVVKHGECVNCNLCEMICPDFAIFSVPAPDARVGAG